MKQFLIKAVQFFKAKLFHVDYRTPLEVAVDNGMTVGKHFQAKEGCIFDPGHVWLITIGDEVTLAPRVHILTHDASTKQWLNYTKIAPVTIGNNVFIGANTTVLPGVTIGDNVIIGANSVVSKDVPSNTVYAGNPARFIKPLEEYIDKYKAALNEKPRYDRSFILGVISDSDKQKMKDELNENKFGFIL